MWNYWARRSVGRKVCEVSSLLQAENLSLVRNRVNFPRSCIVGVGVMLRFVEFGHVESQTTFRTFHYFVVPSPCSLDAYS